MNFQVSGDIYAVDETTLLLQNFVYDGNGKDAFFWAGSSSRPNSKGFIVPDKKGRTNVLDRYLNEEFTIKLPLQKTVTDLKWFSVYDLTTQSNFGDIYIREGFEPPGYRTLTDIPGTAHGVKSAAVVVMDSKTIKIPSFTYDGRGGQVSALLLSCSLALGCPHLLPGVFHSRRGSPAQQQGVHSARRAGLPGSSRQV